MTYGTINSETRAYVEKRAAQGNVSESVKLEYEGSDGFQLSIIVDGALDEEFNIGPVYEVNIADWIAELLSDTCDTTFWEVIVSKVDGNDTAETVYRTSGYSEADWPYADDPRDK